MEAVDEIHILPVRFLQQRGRVHRRDPVPAHMGDLVPSDDFLYLPLEITQALHSRCFLAAFKEQLFAQADAQERLAAVEGFLDSVFQAPAAHGIHAVPKGTHPRQDHFGSGCGLAPIFSRPL